MDPLHVHLYINHLPVFGTFLGILVLLFAIWRKSANTEIAAYLLFIISAIGVVIAYLTGEGAEHAVEHLQGISKNTIERHEDFSIYPMTLLIILGVISLVGIILVQRKSRWKKKVSSIILILSVFCFALIAWTGYLGGQIRHTEINGAVIETSDTIHERGNAPVSEIQLNNGAKWEADVTTNQAIKDLVAMINSSEKTGNNPELKDAMTGRINRLFKECTMKGEADKQLHHYLIPLINKVNLLNSTAPDNTSSQKTEILSYLNTYQDYFD